MKVRALAVATVVARLQYSLPEVEGKFPSEVFEEMLTSGEFPEHRPVSTADIIKAVGAFTPEGKEQKNATRSALSDAVKLGFVRRPWGARGLYVVNTDRNWLEGVSGVELLKASRSKSRREAFHYLWWRVLINAPAIPEPWKLRRICEDFGLEYNLISLVEDLNLFGSDLIEIEACSGIFNGEDPIEVGWVKYRNKGGEEWTVFDPEAEGRDTSLYVECASVPRLEEAERSNRVALPPNGLALKTILKMTGRDLTAGRGLVPLCDVVWLGKLPEVLLGTADEFNIIWRELADAGLGGLLRAEESYIMERFREDVAL